MKLLTYILALTIVMLSVKPGVMTISLSSSLEQSCCSSIRSRCSIALNTQDVDNHSDHQEIRICNPFQTCGSCLLICESTPFYTTIATKISNEQNFGYQVTITTSFTSDLWKPPRFA